MAAAKAVILEREREAFESRRAEFETAHQGQWTVFHGVEFCGFFSSFEDAANSAVSRFGRGPYLIRQVSAPDLVLPTSVMARMFDNAAD